MLTALSHAVQNQKKAEKAKRKFDAEVDRAEAGLSKTPRQPLTAEERADAEQCVCPPAASAQHLVVVGDKA